MSKRILYISYDGMTDPLGQSQVLPYLTGLSKLGYEFTLLSFEKKERLAVSGELIRNICNENNIRWVPQIFSTRPPILSKIWDGWKMKRKVLQLHREHQFDFTHCRSYVAASAGLYLYRREKVPYLFDMRGFWVDERVDNGQWNLGNPLYKTAYRIYKKKEKKYFQQAKQIVSLTHKGKEELVANYGVAAEKIAVIPCCADLSHFDYNRISSAASQAIRNELGVQDGDKILSYLGSLGGWYLTAEMLDFFKTLKEQERDAKFLFITQDKKEDILKMAAAKGITAEDILVRPATRQQVPAFITVSDWSIFFIKDAYSKKASSPTKQGEIMAMGVPIICNDIGDTGKIIEESGAGIVIRQLDAAAYQKGVVQTGMLRNLDKSRIRSAAFNYYDLKNGVAVYSTVYSKM
jgi:glycosyltransferase involved in cell wall biosynthesis